MIITDEFIMINLPKTGSTFAVSKMFEVHGKINKDIVYRIKNLGKKKEIKELLLPNIKVETPLKHKDKHGTYSQIPKELLSEKRTIMSIIRNPYDAYVSRYKYKAYADPSRGDEFFRIIRKDYPNFPDFSFSEYLQYIQNRGVPKRIKIMGGNDLSVDIGVLSLQFIQMYAIDPKKVLDVLDYDFFEKGFHKTYFPDIHFLKNENLSAELYDFLLNKGYKEKYIEFIKSSKKINVSVKDGNHQNYYTPADIKFIKSKEWFLFEFFPDYKRK